MLPAGDDAHFNLALSVNGSSPTVVPVTVSAPPTQANTTVTALVAEINAALLTSAGGSGLAANLVTATSTAVSGGNVLVLNLAPGTFTTLQVTAAPTDPAAWGLGLTPAQAPTGTITATKRPARERQADNRRHVHRHRRRRHPDRDHHHRRLDRGQHQLVPVAGPGAIRTGAAERIPGGGRPHADRGQPDQRQRADIRHRRLRQHAADHRPDGGPDRSRPCPLAIGRGRHAAGLGSGSAGPVPANYILPTDQTFSISVDGRATFDVTVSAAATAINTAANATAQNNTPQQMLADEITNALSAVNKDLTSAGLPGLLVQIDSTTNDLVFITSGSNSQIVVHGTAGNLLGLGTTTSAPRPA